MTLIICPLSILIFIFSGIRAKINYKVFTFDSAILFISAFQVNLNHLLMLVVIHNSVQLVHTMLSLFDVFVIQYILNHRALHVLQIQQTGPAHAFQAWLSHEVPLLLNHL